MCQCFRLAAIKISLCPDILCRDTLREATCYLSKQDLLYLKRKNIVRKEE
ncbi:hypothetical protein T12_11979 [Trichinella patagoniensis]|uniref:Uncharacterized protein n=1 Tax=Trichinella patagoniensis TaxID=990121 RepID=A0A0V0YS69_9BILA|nr:hypothetical protein T12_11979 [Trichinella patagoniensis]